MANRSGDDAWFVQFVRSTSPHGRITRLDTAAAADAPGVVAVVDAASLGLAPFPPELPGLPEAMRREHLAREIVRYVGEPIAAVVAVSPTAAADAATLVEVDIEPLPPLIDLEASLAGAVLLHPDADTNVALRMVSGPDDVDDVLARCEVVVEAVLDHPTVAPVPLEGRSVRAWPDGGRLHVEVSGQGPHPFRSRIASVLGLDPQQVHVVCPDVGGSFGGKAIPHPEEVVVARLAQLLDHEVTWTETRSESLASSGPSRGQRQWIRLGGRSDGTIEVVHLRVLQDAGAYPRLGAFLVNMGRLMLSGPYRIPVLRSEGTSVLTTTNPHVAYRGAGQPEVATALEHAVDRFAHAVGIDPAEVRRRNLVGRDDFPYTSPTGAVYDSGDYERGLDLALSLSRYDERRHEQRRRRDAGERRVIGLGVSTFVESTSTSNQPEHARVRVGPDGTIDAWAGSSPHGQGHETIFATLVVDQLGGDVSRVRVHTGDSDHFPSGTVTGGSRSVQTAGIAVRDAAALVRDDGLVEAAARLEADPADVVYDRARQGYHVVGTPARLVALADAAAAHADGCLERALLHRAPSGTIASGAYVAEVEVDLDTGHVALTQFVAVDDCGRVVNHELVEGQVHGGVVQGIGQALWEAVRYDDDGTLRTATLLDYLLPGAPDVPMIETGLVETPSPHNALGVKGVGESGPIGAVPAVHGAVIDALRHLGVYDVALPATPEAVWRAVRATEG